MAGDAYGELEEEAVVDGWAARARAQQVYHTCALELTRRPYENTWPRAHVHTAHDHVHPCNCAITRVEFEHRADGAPLSWMTAAQ